MYGGIINNIVVYKTEESARKHFFDFVNENGGWEVGDSDFCRDGSDGTYYWWDGDDNEIEIVFSTLKE